MEPSSISHQLTTEINFECKNVLFGRYYIKVKISVFKKNRVRPLLHQGCENSRLDRINQLIAIYNKCGITWFLTTFYLGKSCFVVFCTCLHPQQ